MNEITWEEGTLQRLEKVPYSDKLIQIFKDKTDRESWVVSGGVKNHDSGLRGEYNNGIPDLTLELKEFRIRREAPFHGFLYGINLSISESNQAFAIIHPNEYRSPLEDANWVQYITTPGYCLDINNSFTFSDKLFSFLESLKPALR